MKNYSAGKKRRMSLAYIMISGINDTDEHLGGIEESSVLDQRSGSTFFLIIQFRGIIIFLLLQKEFNSLSTSWLSQEFQLQSGNQEGLTYQLHADLLACCMERKYDIKISD